MKPIAIHLDRLSAALSAKGVDLKRSDLLQVAAAAFGYHNQNEASAASQKGDLTPSPAVPVCRVTVPGMPFSRTVTMLQDTGTGMVYGVDAEFLSGAAASSRGERYGPTPFGGLADIGYAVDQLDGTVPVMDAEASGLAHLDRAVREAISIARLVDGITALGDADSDTLGEMENSLSRLLSCLQGGYCENAPRSVDENGSPKYTRAEKASYARDVDGMAEAVDELAERHRHLALLSPETAAWAKDCLAALRAGLRIAGDWRESCEQEIRFGPDWRSWTKDLRKAATLGAAPLTDMDLHKIRHAVADNHCKATAGERSETKWRVGQLMAQHARALLLRLDIAEALLAANVPGVRVGDDVTIGSLWKVEFEDEAGVRHRRLYRPVRGETPEEGARRTSADLIGKSGTSIIGHSRAPEEEVALRLLQAARQAVAGIPDDTPPRRNLVRAIAAADRGLPSVHGIVPDEAPPSPILPEERNPLRHDREEWKNNSERAERLQDAILHCAEEYVIDRRFALAALSKSFGFDHARSYAVLEGKDSGVRNSHKGEKR